MIDPVLARLIKLVAFDIDGVMTDGGIYLGDVDGRRLEFKRYDIQDGLGVSLLRRAGVRVAIVTGRISESVRLRSAELGVEDVVQGPDGHKLEGFLRVLERRGIGPEECAFVGDDFPDLPILRLVAMRACVGNAVPEVQRECQIHLVNNGGRGAVREFCELFLKARGDWDDAWNGYVAERSAESSASGANRR